MTKIDAGAGRPRDTLGFGFVGRESELGELLAALSARPAVVLLEGEAGIGKSRLVSEAAARLRPEGVGVVMGYCHPLREPLAYGPVIDALHALGDRLPERSAIAASVGALAPLLPELADRLPAPPTDDPQPGALRQRIADGVRALLALTAPVVLVVEDLHWADEATRELLFLLARDVPRDTALVLTYRAEDLPERALVLGAAYRRPPGVSGTELGLGPLARADLRKMARAALGQGATDALTRTLFERSAGLPLIIEEDLITLSSGGPAPAAATGTRAAHGSGPGVAAGELGVPRSLREVMSERIHRLSPEAAGLVEAAAVLAVPVSEAVLAETAGLAPDDAGQYLIEALAAAVLRENGPDSYGFAHALACRSVYESMPGPLRSRGHRRALAVLQAQGPQPLVQIAHHTRALGDLAGWFARARAAADQAVSVGDLGIAAALLSELLDQPGQPADQLGDTALALSRITRQSLEHGGTAAAMRRILATPGLPAGARGEIRLHLGTLLANQAGGAGGWDEIETAVLELEEPNPTLAARAMSMFATVGTDRFSAAEQRAWGDRARGLVTGSEDLGTRAIVEANYITALATWADPATADLLAALARDGAETEVLRGTACALSNAAESALCVGLDQEAARCVEESLALGGRIHLPSLAVYTRSYHLLLTWFAGHWTQWESDLAAYREQYPDSPLTDTGLLATAQGVTAAARGRTARAAELFDRALNAGELHIVTLGAAAGAARLRLAKGDADGAWDALTAALALARRKEAWPYALDLLPTAVDTALARGDRSGARELTERHAAGIEGRVAPAAAAEQQLCRGLLLRADDPDAALAAFERAEAQWRQIGRPYSAALALERAALTRTEPADAVSRLTEAAAAFELIGAASDAARCQHRLRVLGRPRPTVRGRSGYGDTLSPREHEVRDLLAQGASNNDIAAALFLSPRTAEHHVASVIRKLRTTRAALAREADQH